MAEFLLNEENRQRLTELMQGVSCPEALDPRTFSELRSGRRTAVSMRGLDEIARASGRPIYKDLANSPSHR